MHAIPERLRDVSCIRAIQIGIILPSLICILLKYAEMGNEMVVVVVRLPGRHVEKPDTLVLFPSSVREQKIEGLELYTYTGSPGKCVYLCPVRSEMFNRTSRPKTGQYASKPDTWQP